jgi:hypothetical protein
VGNVKRVDQREHEQSESVYVAITIFPMIAIEIEVEFVFVSCKIENCHVSERGAFFRSLQKNAEKLLASLHPSIPSIYRTRTN